jgi:hypothetical protein
VIFSQLGYFWKIIGIFLNEEDAQRNGNILGYFLQNPFSLFSPKYAGSKHSLL